MMSEYRLKEWLDDNEKIIHNYTLEHNEFLRLKSEIEVLRAVLK